MSAFTQLEDALAAHGCKPRNGAARCPAHDDKAPSLSYKPRSKDPAGVLVKCHAGCELEDILTALDLEAADLFDERKAKGGALGEVVARYAYTDEAGQVLYTALRFVPKAFRPERASDGKWTLEGCRYVLYRLPDVLAAVAEGRPVYVVEGEKDADAIARTGAVATCNVLGAGKWLEHGYADALRGADVVVIVDKDDAGRAHAADVVADLTGKARSVTVKQAKTGKDATDHLAAGHSLDELEPLDLPGAAGPRTLTALPRSLDEAHAVFRRWLGDSYDLQALTATLAAAAVEQLDGDPVWLLMLSGSGNAKTETVGALVGAGGYVTSTITSEGALLSATSRKDTTKDATGGLLRKIGDRGLLVIKDFTSVLSMNRDVRASVLAALREVYDGRWERNVGVDGGKSLTWTGRIVLIGAVTTAYDQAHGVISSMGDRFALVRVDSHLGRLESGRQALANVGHEVEMRADLAEAAGGVLAGVDPGLARLDEHALGVLLAVANIVTLARTAVERDQRGDVVEAHAPEAPTRFAKMLGQLVRGTLALGADDATALGVALRVAGDSVPPVRLAVLGLLFERADQRTSDVTKALQRPRSTVDRTLQELHLLGLVHIDDVGEGGWRYRLAADVDRTALLHVVTRKVTTPGYRVKKESSPVRLATDIPGDACTDCGWPPDSLGHLDACARRAVTA